MIRSLAHACLKTNDLQKTTDFYCDTLGMEKVFHFKRKGEVIGFYLKASANTFLEVFLADQTQPSSPSDALGHFCLQTDAIEALQQRVVEKGYAPGPVKMGADHSYQFWVKDPSGIDVEFHQYTAQSTQFSGIDVEVDW